MIRQSLRIITVLSLLLFVGCAVLWVRSYSVSDFMKHEVVERNGLAFQRKTLNIACGRGGVCFNRVREIWIAAPTTQPAGEGQGLSDNDGWDYDKLTKVGYAGNYLQLANQPTQYGFAKASREESRDGAATQSSFIVFPLTWGVLGFGFLPFVGSIRLIAAFRRHRRLKALNYHEVHTKSAA